MSRIGFILVALVMAIVVATGCSRKHTYVAPGGKVTVNEKGGETKTIEVQTKDGKATIDIEKKSISEKELGVPVYPGASVEMSGNYQGDSGGKSEQVQHNMLTTPDDFDKVCEFYKSKLKNVQNTYTQTTGDSKITMLHTTSGDGAEVNVQIMADTGKKLTRIQVVRVQKPKK